jgi:Flp pilus assembly protein TadD
MSFSPTSPKRAENNLSPKRSRRAAAAAILAAFLALGGCKSVSMNDVTGSLTRSDVMPKDDAGLRQYAEMWGKRFEANPGDKIAAINYAKALRAQTQFGQAVAVLQRTAIKMPEDMDVLGNYGKALADAGRLEEAAEVLQRAHTPERPNWSILSAQGSVADQMGNHEGAQAYYTSALKMAPENASILSNLGLSYALSKNLGMAEQTLRLAVQQPAADQRVRQNLALVLALQGKFAEAETVSARDLPPAQAAQNVNAIRQMIAQSNTWRELQAIDRPANGRPPTRQPRRVSTAPGVNRVQTAKLPSDDSSDEK